MKIAAVAVLVGLVLLSWRLAEIPLALSGLALLPLLVFALWPRSPWWPIGVSAVATVAAHWTYAIVWIGWIAHTAKIHGTERHVSGEGVSIVFCFLVFLTLAYPVVCVLVTAVCAGVRWAVLRVL